MSRQGSPLRAGPARFGDVTIRMSSAMILAVSSALALAGAASAQPAGGPSGPGGPPPKPPKAALDACVGKAAKAVCEVKVKPPVAGKCLAPPGLPLACIPNDAPRPPEGAGPPPPRS